jgi:hypothetical protein
MQFFFFFLCLHSRKGKGCSLIKSIIFKLRQLAIKASADLKREGGIFGYIERQLFEWLLYKVQSLKSNLWSAIFEDSRLIAGTKQRVLNFPAS